MVEVRSGDALVERLVRQDRAVVLLAISALVAISIAYLVAGPSMPTMEDMPDMAMPMAMDWASFSWLAPMWIAMMIGMMLPSAAPMLLLFARHQRFSDPARNPAAATLNFAGGYLAVWIGFSLLAAFLQAYLSGQSWLTDEMRLGSPLARAALLAAAGIFELTPLKSVCLESCRSPAQFLAAHARSGNLAKGLRHGLFCLGCCAALMGLLFVAGVMNPLAIGALAVIVLAQKLAPPHWRLDMVAGIALMTAAVFVLARG